MVGIITYQKCQRRPYTDKTLNVADLRW